MGYFWTCNVCQAQNSVVDGTCQFCECQGAVCERDNCDDPRHFTNHNADHIDGERNSPVLVVPPADLRAALRTGTIYRYDPYRCLYHYQPITKEA